LRGRGCAEAAAGREITTNPRMFTPMATDTLTMSADSAHAVSGARHELAARLDRWTCGRIPDAVLVFSELVTNALMHAGGAIRIVVAHGEHTLRLEVHDRTHSIPVIADISGAAGGFGLKIVEQLSESWGWEQTGGGKVVWAELDCCNENGP
jgi:anti-sigma regulatory factor (Ser/Thr protein kinase)